MEPSSDLTGNYSLRDIGEDSGVRYINSLKGREGMNKKRETA
jgi:hypothetical protein